MISVTSVGMHLNQRMLDWFSYRHVMRLTCHAVCRALYNIRVEASSKVALPKRRRLTYFGMAIQPLAEYQ